MIAYTKLLIAAICLSLLLLAAPIASTNDFTLEQVMSAPFPSDLITSAHGDKLAWVFYKEGKRNLWLAEAPAFKGRQLTRYNEDDGQEILQPVFSPDGKLIRFIPIPEDTLTNCAFGGKDLKTLYVTAGKGLYQVEVPVAGTRR